MNIILFGTPNYLTNCIIKQALAKNYGIKAFSRDITKWISKDEFNDDFKAVKGYLFDEGDVFKALENIDVVISCAGINYQETDKARTLGLSNLLNQMQKRGINRIIILSGFGILQATPDKMVFEVEGFDEQLVPVSEEHFKAWKIAEKMAKEFALVAAPLIIDEDFSGNYITNIDNLPEPNLSKINAGDLADYLIKLCIEEVLYNQRIGISTKN